MPNTTNYSFPTPADTDLVKNGADAIRDLGDAVDTAMNTALGTKKAMGVLLSTVSFSGVSSQSIGSDASPLFTSAYKNYRIFFSGKGSLATPTALRIRLRANITDSTAANYYFWQQYRSDTTGGTDYGAAQTSNTLGIVAGALRSHAVIDISYPQLADYTALTALTFGIGASASDFSAIGGYHNLQTSYNGITFFVGSGTITGEVSVYGYNA
jgi:hypothetical protein